MKKILCFVAIAILSATNSFSQTTFKKNTFSISAGPSFAIGNFSSTDPSNPLSGFANTGQNVNLFYTYQLNNHVGIIGMIYGERNGLNTKAMAVEYGKALDIPTNAPGERYQDWDVGKSNWLTGALMIGVSGIFKPAQSAKISIIAKALTGLAYLQSPKIHADSKPENGYAEINREKGNGLGQSYFVSGGLKYATGVQTAITFTGDFFKTNQVSFKEVTETLAATNGGLIIPGLYSISNSRLAPSFAEHSGTYKQPLSSFNLNVGFSFSF